ncbi:hypothetical protein C8J57DRAFT_1061844 [Mycena rebaudengoi]|nr:hypothetical protein C8J57DRAFT_1061844 [Mycena rebaudengoi]
MPRNASHISLVSHGIGDIPEPTSFTQAELDKYFRGSAPMGSNSRCRATRSHSIGWNSVKTSRDLLVSVRP